MYIIRKIKKGRSDKVNKLLRVVLILIIIALAISAVIHLFSPATAGGHLENDTELGWKREVGIWNLAILPILISIQFKQGYPFLTIIVLSLFIGHIGLGTNHLFSFMGKSGEMIYIFVAIGNYLFALLLILGLRIERLQYKDDTKLNKKSQIKWAQF